MTRDQLIEKRKRKKRIRLGAAVCGAVALCLIGTGLYRASRKPSPPPEAPVSAAEFPQSAEIPAPEQTASSAPESVITGWQSDSQGRYYLDSSGERTTGWFTDTDGSTYFFGDDGYALTGWQEPDIGRVWFDENGVLTTGFREIDGKKYCFGYDGVMLSGWQDDGPDTYYFSEETGEAVTGWQTINGEDCWFDENGVYDPSVVKETGPAVALTFDDGPGVYTEQLLDILEENDAKATFFMIGELVPEFSSSVARELAAGMELGNHSWNHKTLTHLGPEDISDEVSMTNDAIRAAAGENPTLFRPPGGGYNSDVIENSFGLPMILWSIDTLDWQTLSEDRTYNTVMNSVQDGDIILMHEIYQSSLNAAARIIPELKARGFRLVTVSELARIKGVNLTSGTTYGRIV